jgi:hypothetical protein
VAWGWNEGQWNDRCGPTVEITAITVTGEADWYWYVDGDGTVHGGSTSPPSLPLSNVSFFQVENRDTPISQFDVNFEFNWE